MPFSHTSLEYPLEPQDFTSDNAPSENREATCPNATGRRIIVAVGSPILFLLLSLTKHEPSARTKVD